MQLDPTLLRKGLSAERLGGYVARGKVSGDDEVLSHYLWNIALCESLYPVLQCLEVTLRNSIHDALTQSSNDRWFEDARLLHGHKEQEAIRDAKARLRILGKPDESGRIVAELRFGFWTSLFDRRYEQVLWPRHLKSVLPEMPRKIRTRKTVSWQLEEARRLRNRVFHHEPIWYWSDLLDKHARLLETLRWINPAVVNVIDLIDRFPTTFRIGVAPLRTMVTALLPVPSSPPGPTEAGAAT